MKSISHYLFAVVKRILIPVFRLFPLQNKVILENFRRSGFGDDPKYIAEELAKKENVRIIWCYNRTKDEYPDYITPVRINSLTYFYHLCTSKVWVDNVRGTFNIRKRKGQYYIQTWHGTLSLKKVEAEAPTIPKSWQNMSKLDGRLTDLMYTNNDFQKWKYENSFWYNGPVIKCDVPRLSILLNPKEGLKETILDKLGIPREKKVVLYAPTFRKNENIDVYQWNYESVLEAFDKKFGGSHVILIRLHPRVSSKCGFIHYNDKVINVTNYPDIQELLSIADIEINDYSSSMFDFGVLRRPVFLIAKDLSEYKSQDRELEFSFEELPFILATTETELINQIRIFNDTEYREKVNYFYAKIGLEDSGKGSQVVSEIIYNYIFHQ